MCRRLFSPEIKCRFKCACSSPFPAEIRNLMFFKINIKKMLNNDILWQLDVTLTVWWNAKYRCVLNEIENIVKIFTDLLRLAKNVHKVVGSFSIMIFMHNVNWYTCFNICRNSNIHVIKMTSKTDVRILLVGDCRFCLL